MGEWKKGLGKKEEKQKRMKPIGKGSQGKENDQNVQCQRKQGRQGLGKLLDPASRNSLMTLSRLGSDIYIKVNI